MKKGAWIFIAAVCLAGSSFAGEPDSDEEKIKFLRAGARAELSENILPFWLKHSFEDRNDGFVGKLYNDLSADRYAPKNLAATARILWFFSAASRLDPDKKNLKAAARAYNYLMDFFADADEAGYYWRLQPNGQPEDRRKELYGHAFMVYGLSEYYLASGEKKVLEQAQELFELIESRFRDKKNGAGYLESLNREWKPSGKATLSETVPAGGKTMNAHLHLLEAYANLYRIWPDPRVKAALNDLIRLFLEKMLNLEACYFHQNFDEDWSSIDETFSFGHDLEAVWLLCDAAETLGDQQLIEQVHSISIKITDAVLRIGVGTDGGVFYEGKDGKVINPEKVWWPQAEAVSGFLQAWQISQDPRYLDAAVNCWRFIKEHLVDSKNGEWFSSTRAEKRTPKAEKISEWKCPYHNGRACMEIMKRLK